MATAIRIENLGKSYRLGSTHEHTLSDRLSRLLRPSRRAGAAEAEEFWALRGVDLEVEEGEAVGIIGGNGAGKSTLLKILSRIVRPTTGRASVRGRLSSLLEVGTGFHPELSGRENVFLNGTILGMRKAEVARKFDEILEFSGVERFIDTPVKRYSSGMYVRLAFAVAAHLEPDVLVIDEVLAVGDAEFQKRCLGKMGEVARQGRTVLFVSHNLAAVSQLCTRAVVLRQGGVQIAGGVSDCIDAYLRSGRTNQKAEVLLEQTDRNFWLKRVALRNGGGEPTTDFRSDQDIFVDLDYEQSGPIQGLEFGMRVDTALGASVFVTQRPGDRLGPLLPGPARSTVRIPANFLAPGGFSVTVGAHVPGVSVVSLVENALDFSVHETGSPMARYANQNIGCVLAQCDWWG